MHTHQLGTWSDYSQLADNCSALLKSNAAAQSMHHGHCKKYIHDLAVPLVKDLVCLSSWTLLTCRVLNMLHTFPLPALMQDQVSALQTLGIAVDYLSSTRSTAEVKAVFAKLSAASGAGQQQLALLYVTPERLATDR